MKSKRLSDLSQSIQPKRGFLLPCCLHVEELLLALAAGAGHNVLPAGSIEDEQQGALLWKSSKQPECLGFSWAECGPELVSSEHGSLFCEWAAHVSLHCGFHTFTLTCAVGCVAFPSCSPPAFCAEGCSGHRVLARAPW